MKFGARQGVAVSKESLLLPGQLFVLLSWWGRGRGFDFIFLGDNSGASSHLRTRSAKLFKPGVGSGVL